MATSGTWEPRALKKRKETFNVGSSSTFVPSTSAIGRQIDMEEARKAEVAGASEFKGAADLDDLEEGDEQGQDAPAKKPRMEASTAAADTSGMADAGTPAAASSSADKAPTPAGPARDEVAEGAPRLGEHIKSASKFNKVASMCFALLDAGRVTRANAGPFFSVLEAALENPLRLREQPYRVAYRKLFTAALAKSALFPERAQPTLKLWRLSVLAQLDLFTDDSYQFNRAASQIREAMHGLPCIYKALEPEGTPSHLPEEERPRWATALFDCVGAAMAHFKLPWTKTTCDMLVKALVDRRQNLDEAQQAELQEWNALCKGQKVVRQQQHAAGKARELTSYERKEAEWKSADIAMSKKGGGGDGGGGGLDGWCAKQS
jgi:hypothetical protein